MDYNSIATGIFGIFIIFGLLAMMIIQNKGILLLFRLNRELRALENHFIFCEIQLWLDQQIEFRCNNVPDKKRSELAKRFLRIRFECKKNYYYRLIDKLKKDKTITMQDLSRFKVEMNEMFFKKATQENVPEIVIKKYNQHQSRSEIAAFYLYERILQYDNFRTDVEKLSAIFCVDLMEIYNSAADAEGVIMGLNGEIDRVLKD